MLRAVIAFLTFLTAAGSTAAAAVQPGAARCAALSSSLVLNNTRVILTEYLPGNRSITLPGVDRTCDPSTNVTAALCRVVLDVETSNSSETHMEVWLPDEWYGRVAAVGNAGLNGCIDYSNMDYLSVFHFAVVGTNNGHNGTSGTPFFHAPEVIADYSYRAVHTAAKINKQVASSYYGSSAAHSYYVGCSTGGRQGWKSVENFPDDFDGVLAGAPAFDVNHLLAWSLKLSLDIGAPNGTSSEKFIPLDLWETIRQDILKQCDAIDGVEDGIIDDPDQCNYNPERLLCAVTYAENNSNPACLTPIQVQTVRNVFSPLLTSNGLLLYPRFDPGAEQVAMIFGGDVFAFALDWGRYVLYSPAFTGANITAQQWAFDADALNPSDVNTWHPEKLGPFKKRGGKVITYHGREDPLIASGNSVRFYNAVRQLTGSSPSTLDSFYRFFTVPGMSHCAFGPGAWVFGQGGMAYKGLQNDSAHNVLLSLVDWVEGGTAPDTVIGTKFEDDTPERGISAQRVHCPYPSRSVLKEGANVASEADSWECVST